MLCQRGFMSWLSFVSVVLPLPLLQVEVETDEARNRREEVLIVRNDGASFKIIPRVGIECRAVVQAMPVVGLASKGLLENPVLSAPGVVRMNDRGSGSY